MYHMPQAEPGPVLKAVGDAKALEFRVAVGQLWTFNPQPQCPLCPPHEKLLRPVTHAPWLGVRVRVRVRVRVTVRVDNSGVQG